VIIKVISGRGLAAMDMNGKSDPYLKIFYGAEKYKTSVQKATLTPHWDQTFSIKYKDSEKILRIECWDWDRIGANDFMGQIEIDLSTLHLGVEKKELFPLSPKMEQHHHLKKHKVSGGIELSLKKVCE